MKYRHSSAVGVSLLIAAMLLPAPVAARSSLGTRTVGGYGHPAIDLSKADLSKVPSLARQKRQQLFIQLNARPVTSYQAAQLETAGTKMSDAEKAAVRGRLVQQQNQIKGRITAAGARIQSSFTDTLNGFRVLATVAQARQIARLPGVINIYQVPLLKREDLPSASYMKAIQTWTDTGLTGEGVTIAVLDTGINYYHRNFGGAGNPGFNHDNPTKVEPGTFPTAKVIGGYDFVGDNYDPEGTASQQVPHPDKDPLDCKDPNSGDVQHGSHVAGIAAGTGVKANGQTYTGAYTAGAVNSQAFRIGPGIAPRAKLAAYRVFGCDGGSFVVQDAIERAVRDGVDVINMSLGSDLGGPNTIDSIASNAASQAGVVVVAAAGNAGPSAYIGGSPAAAQRVISVGAMDASLYLSQGAIVDFASSTDVGGWNMYDTTLPVSGTTRVLFDGSDISEGCSAGDFSAVTSGNIVVIARGTCAFSDKRGFAQDAGASGVVLVNNEDATIVNPVDDPDHSIPMVSVNPSRSADLVAGDGTSATLHDGNVVNENYGTPASFTSAGPARYSNVVKPDLMAPGVDVVSTDGATVSGGKALSGTSMATPNAAGAAALVLQAHPSWRPAAVKGALVGSASSSAVDPYTVQRGGAGVINVLRASRTVSWAESLSEPGTSSLTFGYDAITVNRDGGDAYSEKHSFRLQNTSSSSITYNLSNDQQTDDLGFVVSMPSSVTVPAHGSIVVTVTVSLSNTDAAALPDLAPNDSPTLAVSGPQLYVPLMHVAGAVLADPTTLGAGHSAVRVPWTLVPRATSEIRSAQRAPFTGGTVKSSSVSVRNRGVHDGNVDVFAWGLSDQNEGQGSIDLRAAGVQSLPTEFGTGVPDPNDRFMLFAVNVWNHWQSGSDNEYDVNIDTNNDGTADFALVGIEYSLIFGPGAIEGVPISLVLDLRGASPVIVDYWFAAAPPNGSTYLLPVLASELNRDPAHPRIFYWVESFPVAENNADPGNPVFQFDVMGTGQSGAGTSFAARYDAFDNPVSQGDFYSLNPGDSASVPISLDTSRYHPKRFGQKGWMFVEMEGRDGPGQADLIPVGSIHR